MREDLKLLLSSAFTRRYRHDRKMRGNLLSYFNFNTIIRILFFSQQVDTDLRVSAVNITYLNTTSILVCSLLANRILDSTVSYIHFGSRIISTGNDCNNNIQYRIFSFPRSSPIVNFVQKV